MKQRKPTVLVVDDKTNMLHLMAKILRDDAHVITSNSGSNALIELQNTSVDVILCDLRMPEMDGLAFLRECKKLSPTTEFILMTAYASVDTAIEALRLGAFDYLQKPFEPDDARSVVLRAAGIASAPAGSNEVLPGLLSCSPAMEQLGVLVRQIAQSDATALLLGETGTGKERIARAIHRLSPRCDRRFVAVNCAAIPAELLESELFGHSKGAFTGAGRQTKGLFEESEGGTLFLDEIGEMRPALQAKLTRALEERAIRRLGEATEIPVDVRVIAATHRDIEAMITSEQFREDLWYRLNVATVRIPPLRDRREDIELLAIHFLHDKRTTSKQFKGFTEAALHAMQHFNWPGNVRQLRAAVERASVVCPSDRIDVGNLPPEIAGAAGPTGPSNIAELSWANAQELGREELSREYLREVLRNHSGDVVAAAKHAKIERESFYRLMRRYNVQIGDGVRNKKKP